MAKRDSTRSRRQRSERSTWTPRRRRTAKPGFQKRCPWNTLSSWLKFRSSRHNSRQLVQLIWTIWLIRIEMGRFWEFFIGSYRWPSCATWWRHFGLSELSAHCKRRIELKFGELELNLSFRSRDAFSLSSSSSLGKKFTTEVQQTVFNKVHNEINPPHYLMLFLASKLKQHVY